MELKLEMEKLKEILDQSLGQKMQANNQYEELVIEAMDYSLFTGGKRIRPILCMKAYELFKDSDYGPVLPYADAIEMIHTYSLIHDDLPAMDNDDYRRGQPTNHKKFGQAMAILAGDGLLNLAFETLLNAAENPRDIQAAREIAQYSGIQGMVSGQVVDLHLDQKDRDVLAYMYKNKTAALIEAGIVAGAIKAGASQAEVEIMREFGYNLGMSYQIQDDFLDLEEDQAIDKLTYISLYGPDKAREDLGLYSNQALASLEALGSRDISFFKGLIESLEIRKS